jgi:hypothetical protein
MDRIWPAGVRRALTDLWQAVSTGDSGAREGQYHLTMCQVFRDATAAIGPLDLQRRAYYTPLEVQPLLAAAETAAPSLSM